MLSYKYPPWGDIKGGKNMEKYTHTNTKAVLDRMSRAIGHLEAVKRMVEGGRDCSEVLIQLSAVRSEITGVSKLILKEHIDHCVMEAVWKNDAETMENLKKAIESLL